MLGLCQLLSLTCCLSLADHCLIFPWCKEMTQNPVFRGMMLNQFMLVLANLQHSVQNPQSLKCVFLEISCCLHPPFCVGGQLRWSTQKVFSRARSETCNTTCPSVTPFCLPSCLLFIAREKGFREESLHLLKMADWLFEPFLAPTHVIRAGFLLSLKLTNVVYHIKPIYSGYMREEEG